MRNFRVFDSPKISLRDKICWNPRLKVELHIISNYISAKFQCSLAHDLGEQRSIHRQT